MLNLKRKILPAIRKSKAPQTVILSAAIATLVASGGEPTGGTGGNGGGTPTNTAPTFAS